MSVAETGGGFKVRADLGSWRVSEENVPGQILQACFELGREQMARLQTGGGPLWLEMWLGGMTGRVYQVGRSMEYHGFSLAQMLVAKRNDLNRKLASGRGVEVHDGLSNPGGLPRYAYVKPDPTDRLLLEAEMAGALAGFDPQSGDYRTKVVLKRGLGGEAFLKP